MPLYRCFIPEGSVALDVRPKIAKAFTDVHCGITGAPRDFVHVLYFDNPPNGSPYTTPYYIDGDNRAGRPPEVRQRILDELLGAFREIAGVPADQIDGRIHETPASWFMENGEILPEPGEEY